METRFLQMPALIVIVLGSFGPAAATPACQDRSNLCQGIHEREVNSKQVKLVGLLESFAPFDSRLPANLTVAWPALPPALAGRKVRIQASSLTAHSDYRMDTRVPGAATFEWDLELLDRLRLGADQLGVRAYVPHPRQTNPDFERIYLPLRIWQGQPPQRGGGCTVKLVPEVRLQEIYVSLAAADLEGCPLGPAMVENQPLGFGNYPAMAPVEFALPEIFGLPGLAQAGFYRVDLLLQDTVGGTMSYRFLFYREGTDPELRPPADLKLEACLAPGAVN